MSQTSSPPLPQIGKTIIFQGKESVLRIVVKKVSSPPNRFLYQFFERSQNRFLSILIAFDENRNKKSKEAENCKVIFVYKDC
jgi:hypothetical protein